MAYLELAIHKVNSVSKLVWLGNLMLLFTDTKCLQLGCFYVFPFQISLEKLGSNMIQNQPELLAIGRPGSLGPAPQDTLQIIKVLFKIREC